ncbi:hypothetical protein Bca4012_049623 [Brassica carinata]|uniref:Uncharacterized protein n=1 Tax=Brassica carinata TaxID=52824 RepID=A0A8X7R4L6_BRACI|nr:hypothetical protein Bca52824_052378 [Brassica carinata]
MAAAWRCTHDTGSLDRTPMAAAVEELAVLGPVTSWRWRRSPSGLKTWLYLGRTLERTCNAGRRSRSGSQTNSKLHSGLSKRPDEVAVVMA